MDNPFEFHEEDGIIACVGDNGGTTDDDIRNGFKRTVEILIKSLKVSQEVEDLLVYPIVYNARHSIELSLKIVIKMLWELERKKKISHSVEFIAERKKKLHTHNIEELYKMACENKNIDRRVPAYFENIEDMIQFYYFDEEGDAFKYELNKDDQPHMIKNQISHISIEILETEFKAVMEKFDDLIYFLGSCVDEYSLGTFTKSLSRTDIGEISKKLPVYEEWSTEKFKEVKDQIKQEYQLGSKELTDALNLIKKHRLFSSNIGCERMFGTITEDELKEYASLVKYYCKKNKSKENIVTEGYKLEEVQQNAEILRKYLSSISMETLRTLLCFYEMGNSNLAVEKLEDTYKYIVDSAFDEKYMFKNYRWNEKVWSSDIRKTVTGCIGRRESRTLILENIHNTQMCLPLKPVLSRDRRGLPNFMDEPTASLDPISEREVYRLSEHIFQEKTTLFITHRLGAVSQMDEILVLDHGQLVEHGCHEELMRKNGVYRKLYQTQKEMYVDEI